MSLIKWDPFREFKQECADLRTMEERLVQSERLATIGRFASQIAHEIRKPLSSIALNVELLAERVYIFDSITSMTIRKDTDHPGSRRRYLEYYF